MNGPADRCIRRTTIGCVGILALIAGAASNLHMHLLVELYGQPGWAALTPLSVDRMIVAAEARLRRRIGWPPDAETQARDQAFWAMLPGCPAVRN